MPFGEVAVLPDGRLVTTPWLKSGVYIESTYVMGPLLRMPDADLDNVGNVWIVATAQQDPPTAYVRIPKGTLQWLPFPIRPYGSRMICKTDGADCLVAYTSTAFAWVMFRVTAAGMMTQVGSGTIPTGEGAQGMACWNGLTPLPISPLDTTLIGHKVRNKLFYGDTIIACGLFTPDQIVMAKGGKLGTLHQPDVDWNTLRISSNGKYWAGVKYVGEQVFSGAVPTTVPHLAETTPNPQPQPQPEPKPVPRPNHLDIVQMYCNLAAQKFPVGPDRGFFVLNKVCQNLKAEGYGLLAKTSGNNYKGYSVDKIIQKDGTGVDILTGPDNDQASWSEITPTDPNSWRPAVDVDGTVPTPNPNPDPTPLPNPSPVDLKPILDKLDAQAAVIIALTSVIQQLAGSQQTILTALNQVGVDVNKVRPVVMNGKVLGFGATFNGQVG